MNTPHPLLGYPEFILSEEFNEFWRTTWGQSRTDVFAKLSHRGKEYEYLKVLPPRHSNPGFNSMSMPQAVLICSEYDALWKDLTSELNGIDTGLPTVSRPDPSPWDQMNEHLGKPWHHGYFHNDDGSQVLFSELDDGENILDDGENTMDDGSGDPVSRVFTIIGQPGIGKSMSLYVVLALRLIDSKPTFLQTQKGEAHFFCSSGAYKVMLPERGHPSWARNLTTEEVLLFDSNKEVKQPDDFWSSTPNPIVLACSPTPKDERIGWTKDMSVTEWYMRPMSLREFLAASTLQTFDSLKQQRQQDLLERCYNALGPNARRAYHYCKLPTGIERYENVIKQKIKKMTSHELRVVLSTSSEVDDRSISQYLMLITAGPRRYYPRVGFVTSHVYGLVRDQYEREKSCRIIDLFSVFRNQPETRASAEYIFKDTMHRILKRGICLEVRPMIDTGTGTKNHLYDTQVDHPTQWLRIGDVVQLLENRVTTESLCSHVFGKEEQLLQGTYCQPRDSNTAAFDAYFWNAPEKTIWMFQFAVSQEHDAKESGLQWIRERVPNNVKTKFVVFAPHKKVRLSIQMTSPKVDAVYHAYTHDIEALAQGH
ncbi:hypothetical protein VKT23_015493 [Stygiomarasmius scandens]|uniref:Uncharacterized protein n=1 Tax=Marasmiellus scandens TaxID=2682957 RepID=A0ABR1IY31_9AGAR